MTTIMEQIDALERISAMVQNFDRLCCAEENCQLMKSRRINFSNFSVTNILKPDFGSVTSRGYDSDGSYVSETCDVYSSGDDVSQDSDWSRSQSPETLDSDQPLDLSERPVRPDAFSIFRRFRDRYEEDGYSSSSDSESALDLRIARKKTPPKMTSQLPAWVFCTRYSDRPSTGRRARTRKQPITSGHRRTRTAFNEIQLRQLNIEFERDPYLSEPRRQALAETLGLNETNVKIWFQNRRAKLKRGDDHRPLAARLKAEGLYNHTAAATNID